MNTKVIETIFHSCNTKQEQLKTLFQYCKSTEEVYQKIIELGTHLPPLPVEYKTPERIVSGCQSIVYLHSYLKDENIVFEVESEALISKGLAALLILVYSGEPPEVVIKCPPLFIKDLGLEANMTPSRSNGLSSIHLKMKQEALKFLINK